MNDPIRRTDSVKIKLAPEVLARLEAQARSYGMPPSTLCAFAVADWLQRQENNARMTRDAVMGAVSNFMPDADKYVDLIAERLPGLAQMLSAPQQGEGT